MNNNPNDQTNTVEDAKTREELLAEVQALRRKLAPPPLDTPPLGVTVEEATAPLSPVPPSLPNTSVPLTQCPACSRKLLTQASALCNWCGAKIDDPKYQEQAARSRQEMDQSELSQLETMVQEESKYGIFGRLKRRAKDLGPKNTLG